MNLQPSHIAVALASGAGWLFLGGVPGLLIGAAIGAGGVVINKKIQEGKDAEAQLQQSTDATPDDSNIDAASAQMDDGTPAPVDSGATDAGDGSSGDDSVDDGYQDDGGGSSGGGGGDSGGGGSGSGSSGSGSSGSGSGAGTAPSAAGAGTPAAASGGSAAGNPMGIPVAPGAIPDPGMLGTSLPPITLGLGAPMPAPAPTLGSGPLGVSHIGIKKPPAPAPHPSGIAGLTPGALMTGMAASGHPIPKVHLGVAPKPVAPKGIAVAAKNVLGARPAVPHSAPHPAPHPAAKKVVLHPPHKK